MHRFYAADVTAVSARSANNLPRPDSDGRVDMRTGGRPLAGSYVYEGDRLVSTPHSHDLHQIEYALRGYVEVQTSNAHYLLPPQQAAWIPAGVEHTSTIHGAVRSISVAERDFFRCFANLVNVTLDQDTRLRLPASAHAPLAAALAHTRDHLSTVTAGQAAAAAGVSERTLRRLCSAELGMSWRSYLTHARLLKAMALLTDPATTVVSAATAVGFDSPSAFTRAFLATFGETPRTYQRRVMFTPAG
jgi:AraC-like DNA-binding protein